MSTHFLNNWEPINRYLDFTPHLGVEEQIYFSMTIIKVAINQVFFNQKVNLLCYYEKVQEAIVQLNCNDDKSSSHDYKAILQRDSFNIVEYKCLSCKKKFKSGINLKTHDLRYHMKKELKISTVLNTSP